MRCVLLVIATLALAACATSPPSRFYTLSGPPAPAAPATTLSIAVGPVAIPAVVDRPEIVVSVGENEVWLDEFNRWASPLAEAIALSRRREPGRRPRDTRRGRGLAAGRDARPTTA